jgi:hypothetical protein
MWRRVRLSSYLAEFLLGWGMLPKTIVEKIEAQILSK